MKNEDKILDALVRLEQGQKEMCEDIGELRNELKEKISELRDEFKEDISELKEDIFELREDMGLGFNQILNDVYIVEDRVKRHEREYHNVS